MYYLPAESHKVTYMAPAMSNRKLKMQYIKFKEINE